jgi:hypothetical protein
LDGGFLIPVGRLSRVSLLLQSAPPSSVVVGVIEVGIGFWASSAGFNEFVYDEFVVSLSTGPVRRRALEVRDLPGEFESLHLWRGRGTGGDRSRESLTMQNKTVILIGVALLAYASARSPDKTRPSRFQHMKGWQKLLGVLAIVMALLIILNPEFLALGFIGDTAFFDVLVVAISLQLQVILVRIWYFVRTVLFRDLRLFFTPSPGTSYLLAVSALAIASVVSAIQKVIHRIST